MQGTRLEPLTSRSPNQMFTSRGLRPLGAPWGPPCGPWAGQTQEGTSLQIFQSLEVWISSKFLLARSSYENDA